jgi:hypothetical protein
MEVTHTAVLQGAYCFNPLPPPKKVWDDIKSLSFALSFFVSSFLSLFLSTFILAA